MNQKVQRYAADAAASACAQRLPVLTGRLSRPFLAIDTFYDPVIPSSFGEEYANRVKNLGNEQWFVREFVQQDGHLNIPLEDRVQAFQSLVSWSGGGPLP